MFLRLCEGGTIAIDATRSDHKLQGALKISLRLTDLEGGNWW
jgi:hypothetical protein